MVVVRQVFEISGLENTDFICLVATFNDLKDQSRNNVTPEVEGRGYTSEQLAIAKQYKAEKFNPYTSCGFRFNQPFDHLKFEPMSYILTLFENYERGHLPFPGSVSEQPAQIMEIFSVLKQLKNEVEIQLRSNVRH